MESSSKQQPAATPVSLTPARRLRSWITSRQLLTFLGSLVVIAIIAVAYFYPDDMAGHTLQQHDMQQGAANGQLTKEFKEATGETSWWTGSLFSGMPTFQISPTYPSNSLFSWINTVMGLGLPAPANLLAMMMIGMFILLICMRLRWYVALIGAVAYGFSSYFIIIIGAGHIWKFITLAYIPPTIAGMVLCYRGRYLAGAALAAVAAMMQIASNHVQMTYYFLFVVAGFVLVYLIKAIREHRLGRFGIATGALVVAAALAVCANLPSLYNTYEYSKQTIRGGHSELTRAEADNASDGLDRDYITQYSYGQAETFSLLIPNIKGGASAKPVGGQLKGLSLYDLDEAQSYGAHPEVAQFLQFAGQYFGEPEGTNGPVYVGALIFALFLVGCFIVRGPIKWVLIALTILSICLALGRNMMWLTDLMIDYMPMYSKFRTPESILVIAEFTMPLMAALALQQLLTVKGAATIYAKPLYIGFGITMFFCLAAMVVPSVYGDVITEADRYIDRQITEYMMQAYGLTAADASMYGLSNPQIYDAVASLRYSMIETDALRSLLVCAFGLGFILLYFHRKISAVIAAAGIGVVVLVDLFTVNKRYLDSESFVADTTYASSEGIQPTEADKLILQDRDPNYRVMDIPRFQMPEPSYFHKAIGGYHAAKLTRYQDLIDRHLIHVAMGQPDSTDLRVLNMLNARYIVMGPSAQDVYPNPDALGNAWFVDSIVYVGSADAEMAELDRIDPATTAVADSKFKSILGEAAAVAPTDTIVLTSYAPNRIAYRSRSARGGVAVFSEVYFPWGWEATVDGKAAEGIACVDYVLRGIRLPAGEHEVVMSFTPSSVESTVSVATVSVIVIYTLVALALLAWLTGWGTPRRREEQPK